MKQKIEFYTGRRKCGKSAYVERMLVSTYSHLCYIGTLPRLVHFHPMIYKHVMRRGKQWSTIELVFDFEKDLEKIQTYLVTYPEIEAVMLDGIWTWFKYQNQLGKQISETVFSESVVKMIGNHHKHWCLLDICPEEEPLYRDILSDIHRRLMEEMKVIIHKEKQYE